MVLYCFMDLGVNVGGGWRAGGVYYCSWKLWNNDKTTINDGDETRQKLAWSTGWGGGGEWGGRPSDIGVELGSLFSYLLISVLIWAKFARPQAAGGGSEGVGFAPLRRHQLKLGPELIKIWLWPEFGKFYASFTYSYRKWRMMPLPETSPATQLIRDAYIEGG